MNRGNYLSRAECDKQGLEKKGGDAKSTSTKNCHDILIRGT
jgi:hypothetical protein